MEKCTVNQLPCDISSENVTKIYQDDNQTQSIKQSATLPLNHKQKSLREPKIVLPTDMKPAITEESANVEKEETFDDRYDALKNLKLNRQQCYTGWSTTVMGTGPFGWSDDLLNAQSSSIVSLEFHLLH